MMKRWMLMLLMLLMPFAALAQDAPLSVIEAALADLNAQLGTSLTLDIVDSWMWDEEDFSDASLGCPQPDQMYAQVITRGYIITFTQDGTTYDYRATQDGSTLFLCSVTQGEATPEVTAEAATPTPAGEVISAENAAQVMLVAQVEGNFAAVMDYSPTGNTIAVAGLTVPDPASNDTPAVLVYNANDLSEAPQALLPGAEPVMSMAYVPTSTGASLVTGGMQGTVAIFPVEPEGFDILFMEAPAVVESIVDVAVSPDGTVIASANNSMMSSRLNEEQGVYLWNASTGEQTIRLEIENAPMSVAFSPDGLLAVGDMTGTIHLWDLSIMGAPAVSATLQGHEDAVRDLQFSPDGTLLASGGMDGTVRLWSVTGEPETYGELTVLDNGEPVLSLDFSPDGTLLAAAGGSLDDEDATNAITLFDVRDPEAVELVATLSGHTGAVGSVAFSPDGTRIASVGGDRTLRLWGMDDVEAVG